jgi:hypothetical protein
MLGRVLLTIVSEETTEELFRHDAGGLQRKSERKMDRNPKRTIDLLQPP